MNDLNTRVEKTIEYTVHTDSGVITDSVTTTNGTWTDSVARLFAAMHVQDEHGVDPLAFDVNEIEVDY